MQFYHYSENMSKLTFRMFLLFIVANSKLIFAERAWEEYLYWQENDKNKLKRINLLLVD